MCGEGEDEAGSAHFPSGEGSEEFLEAWLAAAVPRERRARHRRRRAVLPPAVLVTTGAERRERARRVSAWLDRCLHRQGPGRRLAALVPHATLSAADIAAATGPLTVPLAERLGGNLPRRTGRLPLRNHRLALDLVTRLGSPADAAAPGAAPGTPGSPGTPGDPSRPAAAGTRDGAGDPGGTAGAGGAGDPGSAGGAGDPGSAGGAPPLTATALRDHCYDLRCQRGQLLGALRSAGTVPDAVAGGALGTLWRFLAEPLFFRLPRWWWGRHCTRRLVRSQRHGWYARARGLAHGYSSAEFFADALQLSPADQETVLLHALFADLGRATAPVRLSPWRRRRSTRYVFLLELPGALPRDLGARLARPAHREHPAADRATAFLRAYTRAVRDAGCTATLLLAVGHAAAAPDGTTPLAAAARHFGPPRGREPGAFGPLLVTLPAGPGAWPAWGRAPLAVRPREWRLGPAAAASLQATSAGLAAFGLLATLVGHLAPGGEHDCLGGPPPGRSGSAVVPAPEPEPRPVPLQAEYRAAEALIEEQNARAEQAEAQGRVVRTVAYVGTPVSDDWDQERQRSDGAVPELRGIALAQAQLNDEARSDDQKIWLRVELFDAGAHFAGAVEAAREIVRLAEADPEGLIGVVGFAQSWEVTQSAVRILNAAEVPTLATNATADEMQAGTYYHQLAPPSSREAAIVSRFVHEARIVEDGSGGCLPARAAIVVQDPADLYSKSVGDGFTRSFEAEGGTWRTLWHTPPGEGTGAPPRSPDTRIGWESSIHGVAEAVCAQLRNASGTPTVVFWAARSRELGAFLNDFEDSTDCSGDPLTVVGGNELTNAALSGMYRTPGWLRLYHDDHVLPVGESPSAITAEFNARYAAAFGEDDLWRNDGHAALGYDAMQVIAEAANDAYGSTGGRGLNRESVQVVLYGGVHKAGASGVLDYRAGDPVPRNKPLVILRYVDGHSEPVMSCGAFAVNQPPAEHWGPDGAYDCPEEGD
ncbi:hypothetical protein [Streptomyces hoynatensis]|uniref:Uncharacterized protein n=1 Tax=Streptomyces hoynatensis TaxID=1141874 RepID=A0A3A9YTR5_9ACTN|nr:hypothetical protein [Streptomyces hoynatensis]RKN39452.1 hypothetical protein D7294_20850 [Streptomyces hoynatensis]